MHRAAFLLLNGSTLLIQRAIWTLNLLHKTPSITALMPSIRISNPFSHTDCRCLYQIGENNEVQTPVNSVFPNTRSRNTGRAVREALDMQKCVIVGISGVTNGGKTTLCAQLEKDLPHATHINMDDYFYDTDSGHIPFIEELRHGNYEDVRSINFCQMEKDVDAWVMQAAERADRSKGGHPPLLLIEGILIFNYKPLVPYYSLKYFLTLSKDECWERRRHRRYDPPDPPNYFDLVVWPMYLKNKAYLDNQKDIVFLSGSNTQDMIYNRVLADLKSKLDEV